MFSPLCLVSSRCRITSGWSWRRTGRDLPTWRTRWGRLWQRTWPTNWWQGSMCRLNQWELSQSEQDRRGTHGAPTCALNPEMSGRAALLYQVIKTYFTVVSLATCGAFPVSMAMAKERFSKINTLEGESLHLWMTYQNRAAPYCLQWRAFGLKPSTSRLSMDSDELSYLCKCCDGINCFTVNPFGPFWFVGTLPISRISPSFVVMS